MRHLPEVFAEKVHEAHIRREDAPKGLLEPRPFTPRKRPKTALIAEACKAKYEERLARERMISSQEDEPMSRMRYRGLGSNRSFRTRRVDEFVQFPSGKIRKLNVEEIKKFQDHIEWVRYGNGGFRKPIRILG